MTHLTRPIWLLGLTSLFTDLASEMLFPVMPMFLRSIGFSVAAIGLLEGVAEAVASLSKGYFGRKSDQLGLRLPFVRAGYGLSALSKPLMAVLTNVPGIFLCRALDRVGKGLRTAPRDALLSAESTPEARGRVFGFHRGMDTLGAALGPSVALALLHVLPGQYRTLFLVASVPGALAVLCTLLLREAPQAPRPEPTGPRSLVSYWADAPGAYRRVVAGWTAFALVNSSDLFLLLVMSARGLSDTEVIAGYVFYNLVHAAVSYPAGLLADRLGPRAVLVAGFLLFAAVYAGFAVATTLPTFLGLLALYGAYAASTEGVAKALVSTLVPRSELGTALGLMTSLQGLGALLASTAAGWIWQGVSPAAAMLVPAGGAVLVAGWFAWGGWIGPRRPPEEC